MLITTRAVASSPNHLHFLIGFPMSPINPVDPAEEETVETLHRFDKSIYNTRITRRELYNQIFSSSKDRISITIEAKMDACSLEWPNGSICQPILGRPHSPNVSFKNLRESVDERPCWPFHTLIRIIVYNNYLIPHVI